MADRNPILTHARTMPGALEIATLYREGGSAAVAAHFGATREQSRHARRELRQRGFKVGEGRTGREPTVARIARQD